jgi:OmpA-OmpF porin, OOP family
MKTQLLAAICVSPGLLLLGSVTQAGEDDGWYIGGNLGEARVRIEEQRIRNDLLASGFATTGYDDDQGHLGYKLFGGYQIGRYFALEAGFFNPGNFNFDASTTPLGTLSGQVDLHAGFIDAVGILPLSGNFSALGRVGVDHVRARDRYLGTGAVNVLDDERSVKTTSYKFGAGLQYRISDTVAARLEAERYRAEDAAGNRGDIDFFSIGVTYRWRAPEAAATLPTPAAAPVPAPLSAPVVATRTAEYCAVLDFRFEINRDEIQREEQEKLAVLGAFLTKYPDTTAVIEGHTDNVGTPADNLRLSQRRADSVVAYLRDGAHVAAARLRAVGYGDTRPIADNSTEEGKRANRRIGATVACAPDIEGLTVKPARITMALAIEFDRNESAVRAQYRDEFAKLARFLEANPSATATVEGHTGNLQATPQEAMAISLRRAQAVVDYLVVNFGISRSRLEAQGFGQTRRAGYNSTSEGQQDNRRVNVIIDYH